MRTGDVLNFEKAAGEAKIKKRRNESVVTSMVSCKAFNPNVPN